MESSDTVALPVTITVTVALRLPQVKVTSVVPSVPRLPVST